MQNCSPSSLAVAGPATFPESESQPQHERHARGHSVSSLASLDYSIDSRSTPSAGASRAGSVRPEPVAQYHWCSCELPAQGTRFLRGPLPDDVTQLTLYSYQNSAVVDGECAGAVAGVAAAVDKPEEQPSLPLGSSTSAGSSTPVGNDAARGAPRRDSAERVSASESRPAAQAASAESDPLCARQTLSRSLAARLSEEPFIRIAPLAAVGAAGQTSGTVHGERMRTRIRRPPLPAYLSLNLVAQWHRSLHKRDDKESPLKAVLFVLFLVVCATCILLLLYFFYDALGVCRLHSALEQRLKLTSNCMLTFATLYAHCCTLCSLLQSTSPLA